MNFDTSTGSMCCSHQTTIAFLAQFLIMLTGWESLHRRNNSFREHNNLFSAHMQPCLFLHTQYGLCGIPLTPMTRRQNYLLSTSSLSKKTINMLICFVLKKKKSQINNKYEKTMSDNSQHQGPYCTLVSSSKGPVSLVA